jgi:hypothetical protein
MTMAKAKKKSKAQTKSATKQTKSAAKKKKSAPTPAVFDGRDFAFMSENEGEIVQGAPNKFRLDAVEFSDDAHPKLYRLVNLGPPNGVLALWESAQLFVYVPGKPFKIQFPSESGDEDTRRKKRIKFTKDEFEDRDPMEPIPYEHLVALGKTANGKLAILRLLLAEKHDPDGSRGIIVGYVVQQAGSPSGAGVGNG